MSKVSKVDKGTKRSLGDRMKAYEAASKGTLPGRLPVIIRVDGKAFHTYTRGAEKPFDEKLMEVMDDTARALCEEVQGSVLAYVQSDEISLLIHSYKDLESEAWFSNEIQKMVSVSAGIASATFSLGSSKIFSGTHKRAVFDSRAFVLPESEISNYFIWRQRDCIRNSINTIAQNLFSQKELHGKNLDQVKQLLLDKADIDVDDQETWEPYFIRGRCVKRKLVKHSAGNVYRQSWDVDRDIPHFSLNRSYVEDFFKKEQ